MRSLHISPALGCLLALLMLCGLTSPALGFSFGEPPIELTYRRSAAPFSSDYVFVLRNTGLDELQGVKLVVTPLGSLEKKRGLQCPVGKIPFKGNESVTLSKTALKAYFTSPDRPSFAVHIEAKGFFSDRVLMIKLDGF